MPRNELRTSGLLQAAVIALVIGWVFRDTPASEPTKAWPHVLAGYGLLAATLPWAIGGVDRGEFRLAYSLLLGVLFAAPMAAAALWLADSPYRAIHWGCWALVGAWGGHCLAATVVSFAPKRTG
jgi:hypothetical protein